MGVPQYHTNHAHQPTFQSLNMAFLKSKIWQSACMFLCYVMSYTSRTHISAGHAYLIQHGLLTAKHFGVMSAISYASLIFVKIASGFVLDYFQYPKYSFVVSVCICALLTYANVLWHTPAAFVVLYTLIKCGVTFHRISILKTLRYHYTGEHFGLITSLLQAVSCVGEAGSKFLLGMLLTYLPWQKTWIICATITLAGSLLYFACIENVSVLPSQQNKTKKRNAFFKECVRPLLMHRSFWILASINAISTVTREIMMNLAPQLFSIVFQVSGEKAAILQSFAAIPSILFLMAGGFLVDQHYKGDGIPLATSLLFFAGWALAALVFCVRYQIISLPVYYAIYLLFQGLLSCPIAFLDGYFVIQFFPKESIAMGAAWISSTGYLGAIGASLFARHYTSTLEGWNGLLLAAFIAICVQFALMCYLHFGTKHQMLEQKNEPVDQKVEML